MTSTISFPSLSVEIKKKYLPASDTWDDLNTLLAFPSSLYYIYWRKNYYGWRHIRLRMNKKNDF